MGAVSASMVEPLLQLLKSLHSDVQHEGHCLNIEIVIQLHVQYMYCTMEPVLMVT